jgi:hypothetical protein
LTELVVTREVLNMENVNCIAEYRSTGGRKGLLKKIT